jgi:hypothetical protein
LAGVDLHEIIPASGDKAPKAVVTNQVLGPFQWLARLGHRVAAGVAGVKDRRFDAVVSFGGVTGS